MINSQWIVKKNEDGCLIAASVKRKGKVFQCSPVETLEVAGGLSGTVHLSLESSNAVVLVEEFPEVKHDILDLQIQSKLDQLAIFNMGEVISTSYALLEKRRQKQQLSIVAQPEQLTEEGIDAVTGSGKVHLQSCVPAVGAIAALLQQLGPEPHIVLLITTLAACLIGVRDGIPLFLQSVPLSAPAEVESGVAAHAIGFARQTLQRDFEIDSCRLVCMGEGRDSFDFEGLDEENWVPDWNHCLIAEGDDVIRYPALFGSLFVGNRFSLLPVEYVRAGRLKSSATLLTTVAGIACIVLVVLTFFNMARLKPLQKQLDIERRSLSRDAGDLRRITPEPDMVDRVKLYLQIMDKVAAEPSVSMLLADIGRALPENVFADELKILRTEADEEGDDDPLLAIPPPGMDGIPDSPRVVTAGSPAEQLLDRAIVVSIKCSSEGEYNQVKARFDKTVTGLSARFSLSNVDWDYSEEEGLGSFRAELQLPGDND